MVATSTAQAPHGPYVSWQPIVIAGWDPRGPGNLYFLAADRNPIDPSTIIGLLPANKGRHGEGNGDGESFIGLSLSCDGVHWSEITPLLWRCDTADSLANPRPLASSNACDSRDAADSSPLTCTLSLRPHTDTARARTVALTTIQLTA